MSTRKTNRAMIYATLHQSENQWVTIVGAADSVAEFEAFHQTVTSVAEQPFSNHEQPDPITMLTDDRYLAMVKPPHVFTHADQQQAKRFIDLHRLTQVPLNYLNDRHRAMMAAEQADPYHDRSEAAPTIEVLLGLDKHDPWDSRTDEQKAEDEKHRKASDEAKKKGGLTGDSFDGNPDIKTKEPQLNVRNIEVERGTDGKVRVTSVLATKGTYDSDPEPAPITAETPATVQFSPTGETIANVPVWFDLLALDRSNRFHTGAWSKGVIADLTPRDAHKLAAYLSAENIGYDAVSLNAAGDEIGPFIYTPMLAQHIASGRDVGILWRIDVVGNATLADVLDALDHRSDADGLTAQPQVSMIPLLKGRGAVPGLVWIATDEHDQAEAMLARLQAATNVMAGVETFDLYAVNGDGERLVPKGFELTRKEVVVEPPRPWNERAGELDAMTDEERKAHAKTAKGSDFLFTGQYHGAAEGTIIYIAPRSYFQSHGDNACLFAQPLDIAHLLPPDLREERPGIYRTRSRDFLSVQNSLLGIKMSESLALQMAINLL